MHEFGLRQQTVIVVSAGGRMGTEIVRSYVRAGAIVVALDEDERRVVEMARAAPAQVEPLRLDPFRISDGRRLGEVWGGAPVAALVLLQALRYPDRPGAVIRSMDLMMQALAPALRAKPGRAAYLFGAADRTADAAAQSLDAAFCAYARVAQDGFEGSGVTVNGLRLPPSARAAAVVAALASLTARRAAPVGGAVLPLRPACD